MKWDSWQRQDGPSVGPVSSRSRLQSWAPVLLEYPEIERCPCSSLSAKFLPSGL